MISNIHVLDLLENSKSHSSPFPRVDDLSVELDEFRYKKGRRRSNDFPSRPFPSRLQRYISYLPGNRCCPDCPLRRAIEGGDVKENNILTWSNVTFGTLICEECAQLHKEMNMKGVTLLSFERDEWTLPRLLATVEGGNHNMLKALGQPDHRVKEENNKRMFFVSTRNLFSQNLSVAGRSEQCHQDRSIKNPFSKKKRNDSKRIMDSFKARYDNVDAELYSYHLSKRIMKLCLEFGPKKHKQKEKETGHNFKSNCRKHLNISLGTEVLDISDVSESNTGSCSQRESKINQENTRRHSDSMVSSSLEKYIGLDINQSHSKVKNESILDTSTELHNEGILDLPSNMKDGTVLNLTADSWDVKSSDVLAKRTEQKAEHHTEGNTEKIKTYEVLRNCHEVPFNRLKGRSYSDHFDSKDRNGKSGNKAFSEHLKGRSYSDQFVTTDNKIHSSRHFALVEDMCQDLDRLLK